MKPAVLPVPVSDPMPVAAPMTWYEKLHATYEGWVIVAGIVGLVAAAIRVWAHIHHRVSVVERRIDQVPTSSDLTSVTARLEVAERRIERTPTHEDLRGLVDRLQGVETRVAVIQEQVGGVKGGVERVEHQMALLMRALMEREQKS